MKITKKTIIALLVLICLIPLAQAQAVPGCYAAGNCPMPGNSPMETYAIISNMAWWEMAAFWTVYNNFLSSLWSYVYYMLLSI